jgi:hypothetical protein
MSLAGQTEASSKTRLSPRTPGARPKTRLRSRSAAIEAAATIAWAMTPLIVTAVVAFA